MASNLPLPIARGLRKDFLTGKYSDMRIIDCDGNIYPVHKVILCYQSPFFENAMKEGRFKEGQDNTINLEDKDAGLVTAMLEYMYYQKYTLSSDMSPEEMMFFAIDMYALGDEYMIGEGGDSLTKYVVDKLSEMLVSNACFASVKSAFSRALRTVYEKTSDADKLLRTFFLYVAADRVLDLLEDEAFRELMSDADLPDFAVDLTRMMGKNAKNHERYTMEAGSGSADRMAFHF